MKKYTILFLALVFCLALSSTAPAASRHERYPAGPPPPRGESAPPPQHAVNGEPYFFGHIGLFEPNDSRDGLSGYDSGGNFDIGMGSRVSSVLAIEGSFGGFSADNGPDEVTVVPLTFGLRLIVPHPILEPYVGAGLGLYFADLKEVAAPGFSGIDDNDTTFGGYAALGLDAWLNPFIALNFEGKYHWAEPTFTSAAGTPFDVKVGGWTVNLGIRMSF